MPCVCVCVFAFMWANLQLLNHFHKVFSKALKKEYFAFLLKQSLDSEGRFPLQSVQLSLTILMNTHG